MNRVIITGRLGADPDLRYIPSGTAIATMRVAVDDGPAREGNGRKVVWVDVTFWGKKEGGGAAEAVAQHFHTGDQIIVEGRLSVDEWEKDGQKRYRTFITGDRWEFGAKKQEREGAAA